MGPFDVIKSLNHAKVDQRNEEDFDAAYIPFLINKALSLHIDTVMLANDMNMNAHLSPRMQYAFYFHQVKPRKRYEKWPRKIAEDENLELIKQYFGYNTLKAKQALSILNESQITIIKDRLDKGGLVRNGSN